MKNLKYLIRSKDKNNIKKRNECIKSSIFRDSWEKSRHEWYEQLNRDDDSSSESSDDDDTDMSALHNHSNDSLYDNSYTPVKSFTSASNIIPPKRQEEQKIISSNTNTDGETKLECNVLITDFSNDTQIKRTLTCDTQTTGTSLNDIQNKLNEMLAKHSFSGTKDNNITILTGEIVKVLKKTDEHWWYIQTKDEEKGYVPSTYLSQLPNLTNRETQLLNLTNSETNLPNLTNREKKVPNLTNRETQLPNPPNEDTRKLPETILSDSMAKKNEIVVAHTKEADIRKTPSIILPNKNNLNRPLSLARVAPFNATRTNIVEEQDTCCKKETYSETLNVEENNFEQKNNTTEVLTKFKLVGYARDDTCINYSYSSEMFVNKQSNNSDVILENNNNFSQQRFVKSDQIVDKFDKTPNRAPCILKRCPSLPGRKKHVRFKEENLLNKESKPEDINVSMEQTEELLPYETYLVHKYLQIVRDSDNYVSRQVYPADIYATEDHNTTMEDRESHLELATWC